MALPAGDKSVRRMFDINCAAPIWLLIRTECGCAIERRCYDCEHFSSAETVVAVLKSVADFDQSVVHRSDNIRHLCRMEIPGGGQIVIKGEYAFIGHQHGPD